ncbi:MAG: cobalamin-binding protein [Chlorobiaceae bacterium]|nr:cobalamin-binding protein [Chlorobiaceae bacterium]NTW74058.1 cobalamin-binding protein [Chlorobiaceae bacterium]
MQPRLHRNPLALPLLWLALVSITLAGCAKEPERAVRHTGQSPRRIVSLAPSLTEMLYAIGAGDQLVGRTSACDWPLQAEKVPVVGAFGRPSLELLVSMEPDLVLDVDLADEEAGKKIAAMNIRRERIRCKTPDDIPPALRRLGSLTGHERQADSLAGVIERGLESFRKEVAAQPRKTSVYLEIWDDPLWTGGRNSFVSNLITYAGGRNIGDAVEKEYFEISPEWVITQNPEVIACMYMSKSTPATEKVMKRPGWSGIDAVRNHRVEDRFDNRLYLRPGPRILEGIAGMKAFLQQP